MDAAWDGKEWGMQGEIAKAKMSRGGILQLSFTSLQLR